MKHFLDIEQLSAHDVQQLVARAEQFRQGAPYPQFTGATLVNLFYEASTRTRVSFELAAAKLALTVVNMDVAHSSESKGEQLVDTVRTLAAMGVNLLVLRHREDGLPARIAALAPDNLQVINAGDGQHAHPTQALLDWMTILQYKSATARLKIAIVGNIRHSRVANSFQALSARLPPHELVFVAPEEWLPQAPYPGKVTTSLREGLKDADVVMSLRVQRERLAAEDAFDLAFYRAEFAITPATLAWAKPDVILLHPGPINRGIELDPEVADGPAAVIWPQVRNGVFMRMAVIEWVLKASGVVQ